MGEKSVILRCKMCNGKVSIDNPNTRGTCPSCHQIWNIHWFQEDSAILISPASWKEFAEKERANKLE